MECAIHETKRGKPHVMPTIMNASNSQPGIPSAALLFITREPSHPSACQAMGFTSGVPEAKEKGASADAPRDEFLRIVERPVYTDR